MGMKSKRKGKTGERELAKKLTELFGQPCRRGVQYQGGPDSPDVVGLYGIHIEVKRSESFRLWDALAQATNEAPEDAVPIVCHRRNGSPWVVIVKLEDLPALSTNVFHILTNKEN